MTIEIVKHFSYIKKFNNINKQKIYEALLMSLKERPSINIQNEDCLKVFKLYY